MPLAIAMRRAAAGLAAALLLYIAALAALLAFNSFEGRALWPALALLTLALTAGALWLGRIALRRRTP